MAVSLTEFSHCASAFCRSATTAWSLPLDPNQELFTGNGSSFKPGTCCTKHRGHHQHVRQYCHQQKQLLAGITSSQRGTPRQLYDAGAPQIRRTVSLRPTPIVCRKKLSSRAAPTRGAFGMMRYLGCGTVLFGRCEVDIPGQLVFCSEVGSKWYDHPVSWSLVSR